MNTNVKKSSKSSFKRVVTISDVMPKLYFSSFPDKIFSVADF